MSSDLFQITILSISFFVAFFLTYLILEMMVVVILNRLVFSHWGLVTESPVIPKL
jgi:hypothetical protein